MKILRIIARLNIGGPARNAVLLTEGPSTSLRAGMAHGDGWETVLVCGEVGEGEGDMMYLARERGIEPIIVPELGRELSLINDWKAFWKIYRIICREKPDIVHTHTAKAGVLGRSAALLYNAFNAMRYALCYMLMLHSAKRIAHSVVVVHTFHGHALCGYFGRVKTWFFVWVEKILAIFTDRIITVSEELKKELVEKFRIAPERKFSVVELGFELDELLRLPLKERSDCLNIGIVGRLVPIKNHKMLFRVARIVLDSQKQYSSSEVEKDIVFACSNNNIKFVVIGDGELRQELGNYAGELDIEEMIEFKGWMRDLRKIYKDLDIAVLTSLNEGTPVSIIEAMAAGRPVVATDVGGVRDIVKDGESGFLVRPGDDAGFTEKLLELIKDADKSKRFGECGRELARKRFSKERLIYDIDRVYNNSLLRERR